MTLTLENFFFNIPIYTPIQIDVQNHAGLISILDKTKSKEFHGFNPIHKIESTFKVTTDLIPSGSNDPFLTSGGIGTIKINCKRTDEFFWYFVKWEPEEKIFTKVGQYPSVADFHIYEIKQYKKLLPDEKLKEFTRAIGLAANGVGIGSFVYLRRIFEFLIYDAFNKAKKEGTIDEGNFHSSRMDQKIELLRTYLPNFLVENRTLYSILSLGIHELDEKTCLAHFDTLRVGIEIILDEKLEELKRKEKVEAAKQKLSELKSQIKSKPHGE